VAEDQPRAARVTAAAAIAIAAVFVFALAVATLAAGCSPSPSPPPVSGPRIWCDDSTRYTPQPTLTCSEAVLAANAALTGIASLVVAIEFRYGSWCPPGARCLVSSPQIGHVIYHFVAGPPLLVRVAEDRQTLAVSAGPAQTFPPGQAPAPDPGPDR